MGMIDFIELSKITGRPAQELERIYSEWLLNKKKRNGIVMVDQKLLSLFSGLSTASISLYINKKGSVSREKAEELENIIKCLDYAPSSAAKRLRSQEKKCVGFVAPISISPNPAFYIEILKGVKEEARKYGFSVDLYDIEENQEEIFFRHSSFVSMVDGLITVSLDLEGKKLSTLVDNIIPIVNIHSRSKPSNPPVVNTLLPETMSLQKLLNYLFGLKGFTCPVLISLVPKNHMIRTQKIHYFKESMDRYNLNFDESKHIFYINSHTFSEARRAYREIAKKGFSPDVYICLSDVVATSISRELEKDGKSVAVTGHDNAEISSLFSLTTIDQKMYDTGRLAFERLYIAIRYIMGNRTFPDYSEIELNHELILRDSTERF